MQHERIFMIHQFYETQEAFNDAISAVSKSVSEGVRGSVPAMCRLKERRFASQSLKWYYTVVSCKCVGGSSSDVLLRFMHLRELREGAMNSAR